MINKLCKQCGRQFDTEIWWNKDYCNVRCRKAAKRQREKAAASPMRMMEERGLRSAAVTNPTIPQLDAMAQLMRQGLQQEPRNFCGTIPMWTPPEDVVWTQDGLDATVWVMAPAREFEVVRPKEFNAASILDKHL